MTGQVVDFDDSGGITFEEMRQGLLNIQNDPPMILTADDWTIITDNGKVGVRVCGCVALLFSLLGGCFLASSWPKIPNAAGLCSIPSVRARKPNICTHSHWEDGMRVLGSEASRISPLSTWLLPPT